MHDRGSAASPRSARMQNQFSDIYVTNPPTGTKNNDVIFTTGLNIAFNH
jgi:hypothetical protein